VVAAKSLIRHPRAGGDPNTKEKPIKALRFPNKSFGGNDKTRLGFY
jgi:hypothetical protein